MLRKLQHKYTTTIHALYFTQKINQIFLYSTTTTKLTDESKNSFSNYLVNSLGFTQKQASLTCTKLRTQKVNNRLKFSNNANSVINFLKKHDFDDTHVKKFVSLYPKLLFAKVDKTIKPKFKLLKDEGFSKSDIIRVILKNPGLLHTGSESCLLPVIQALREIMGSNGCVVDVIAKILWREFGYVFKNLLPNVALLRNRGIPIEVIRKQLLWQPATLLKKPENFECIVSRVENKLGISCQSSRYMYGIHLLSGYSEESIESKCRLFESFGWTRPDIEAVLVKNTCCFSLSDARMKKKLDFLMNELRLEPAQLISHSALLTCSLEKRIMPRHNVLLILNEKHLVKKIPCFYTLLCMSESRFLKMFVLPFKEVHDVYAQHTGCDLKKLIQQQAEATVS
ncbi:hypothetical protein vseg_010834 [Gypsophila vaccaria]